MSFLDRIFPGFLAARRDLAARRPPHFRPVAASFAPSPAPFDDLPAPEVDTINESSRRYFEQDGMRAFWINKPFSDAVWTGWTLWRFGHLLTALDLRPGDRVLDFGCGSGWSSMMLARMGTEVVGMDIAPAAIEIARETSARGLMDVDVPRPRFQVYSGGRIDAPDGHFDAIVVYDAFHHLPNPRTVLDEFHRVLAPNSRLGLAEPGIGHAEGAHSRDEMAKGVLERELDLEQLHRSGLAAGFQGMEVLVPGLHPHSVTLPMRRLRWYLRGLSWLVPADHVRLAILRTPIAVFWKGPYFISSAHPRDQSAAIKPGRASLTCRPGEAFVIDADVTNTNTTVWLKDGQRGRGVVRLGAHLLAGDGRAIEQDYGRAAIPHDMARGSSARLELRLWAPGTAGRFIVRLDMVDEGIAWFAAENSPTADVTLMVG